MPRKPSHGTAPAIPKVLGGIIRTPQGALVFQAPGQAPAMETYRPPVWTVAQVRGNPRGTENGIAFDFRKPGFKGTLIFGLVPYHDTKYPQPVFRTRSPSRTARPRSTSRARSGHLRHGGLAEDGGSGVLGYRIITATGGMVYDGRVRFKGTGPFEVDVTMVEGPFVANVEPRQAVIWFELDRPAPCSVIAGARTLPCPEGETHQEIAIDGLSRRPTTPTRCGTARTRSLTASARRRAGRAQPFVFAYSSDSRGGQGGGDRNFNGPNAYIMRRTMALARRAGPRSCSSPATW